MSGLEDYVEQETSETTGNTVVRKRVETWHDVLSPHDLIKMSNAPETAGSLLRRIGDCTLTGFLSQKESACSWYFRDANPDFTVSRAHNVRQALEKVLQGIPMEVLRGGNPL